jgi:hypothetical protein
MEKEVADFLPTFSQEAHPELTLECWIWSGFEGLGFRVSKGL